MMMMMVVIMMMMMMMMMMIVMITILILPLQQRTIAKDQHKKGTVLGGYIEAYLIIRSPLLGPEVVVTEERSLVLEAWPEILSSSSSSSISSSPPIVTSSAASSSSISSSPIVAAAAASITTATAIGLKSSSSSSSSSIQLTKEEMLDPHSVNHIESNEVLEHEISQAEDFIRSCSLTISSVSNNDDDDDDKEGELIAMRIRLQLLQSKLQVLVYKVQNDVLTMEQYLNLLRERIKRDQVLAIYLKQSSSTTTTSSSTKVGDSGSSNVQDALRVLKRVKIMQKEVSDAEENMKSDDT